MRNFDSVIEVFSLLNAEGVEYLVLRNFENLLTPQMYLDGHGDIDLLCRDSQQIVKTLDAGTDYADCPPFIGDGTHYYIFIQGHKVSLDLRYPGDGYYCEQWENNMLATRQTHECFFVLDLINQFYSLIYHAILQKSSLSDEYLGRLQVMAKSLGLTTDSERSLLSALQTFMRERGYRFTYPSDYHVPCRFGLVSRDLVDRDLRLWWSHTRYSTRLRVIGFLVRAKHLILKPK